MSIVDRETAYLSCYACGKCSSGCPTAHLMDIRPHHVVRLLQLGEEAELVKASAPWLCLGCRMCVARCPNQIDIPTAFAQLRREALRCGIVDKAGNHPAFEEIFLGMLRRRGRVNDGLMVMRYKLRAGGLTTDWRMGMKLWLAGKMKLRTPRVKETESLARAFAEGENSGETEE